MNFFGFFRKKNDACNKDKGLWQARMGWRFVSYREGAQEISFQIEPMVKVPDLVYIPDDATWLANALPWAVNRQSEILERLKSIPWNRNLSWIECQCAPVNSKVIPGSLESTPGGKLLESKDLFHPKSPISPVEAHTVWERAAELFAEKAKGKVTIFASNLEKDSVFCKMELPALKANPNVTLIFM